ncbi:MAG: hypothetical protein U9N46_01770 [Euryarchaeota archaeon]|nr:hypothetical protein [Euryarchaeota archaeon]
MENAEIRKSDDDKTIRIFKDENSAEIMINEKEEKVTVKISDNRTHGINRKKENGKLNTYRSEIPITDFPEDAAKRIIDKLLMDEEEFIDLRKRIDEKHKKFYQKYGDKLLNEVDNESKHLVANIIKLSGELEKDSADLLDELQKAKLDCTDHHDMILSENQVICHR